ncbi:hypothetical protein AGMMS50276_07610 [Synergistales bacterium]|nr:hypothetical protein AGMMS50276_07610 [Synergistales bacterium]
MRTRGFLDLDLCANDEPHKIEAEIKNGADVNTRDIVFIFDKTALMCAAKNPNPKVIQLLLENGADARASGGAIDYARRNKQLVYTEAFKLLKEASL